MVFENSLHAHNLKHTWGLTKTPIFASLPHMSNPFVLITSITDGHSLAEAKHVPKNHDLLFF